MKLIKNAWMIFWRLAIVSLIFTHSAHTFRTALISLIAAAVIVFVFKRDIQAFPIARFFMGIKPVIARLPGATVGNKVGNKKNNNYNNNIQRRRYEYQTPVEEYDRPVANQTAERGTMTGYEPDTLENVVVPSGPQSRVFGVPGSGLNASNFSQSNINRGIAGELQFAQALTASGCINSVDSFWSVHMPSTGSMNPDRNMPTDIDCVLVVGNRIMLIDVKNYTGGNGTYYNLDSHTLAMIDNVTGNYVGKWRKMSENMNMATQRFSNNLSGYIVESHVVFVPTSRGAAFIYPGTAWPGEVYATNLDDFISYLQDVIDNNSTMMRVDKNIRNIMFNLTDTKS